MKYITYIISVISVLGMAVIGDLFIRFLLSHTTDWGFLGERGTRTMVFIGSFAIGYFFGGKAIKFIHQELQGK